MGSYEGAVAAKVYAESKKDEHGVPAEQRKEVSLDRVRAENADLFD